MPQQACMPLVTRDKMLMLNPFQDCSMGNAENQWQTMESLRASEEMKQLKA